MKKSTPYAIRRISTVWSNVEERDWERDEQSWIIAFRQRQHAEAYAEKLTRTAELGSAESWRKYHYCANLPRKPQAHRFRANVSKLPTESNS